MTKQETPIDADIAERVRLESIDDPETLIGLERDLVTNINGWKERNQIAQKQIEDNLKCIGESEHQLQLVRDEIKKRGPISAF